jgi:hypothetical protein
MPVRVSWECRCRRAPIGLFFDLFYTRSEEKNGFFTLPRIIVAAMRHTSRRLRQFTLGLLVLVAVGHANLACDLTGRAPNTSGITRLGRDLLRKSFGEPRHILTETAVGYRLVQQPTERP